MNLRDLMEWHLEQVQELTGEERHEEEREFHKLAVRTLLDVMDEEVGE